jgi:hypothetical protein
VVDVHLEENNFETVFEEPSSIRFTIREGEG